MKPCLFLLRLADLQSPAMDKLYYYVRKMDSVIASLKQSLNDLEARFNNQNGENYHSKIINYFVYSQDHSLTDILENEVNSDNTDDDDVSLESQTLEDDMTSDTDSEENGDENRCGTFLERVWIKRSKALRTDIAIAGWMCSPHPDVMEDCINNQKGEHRLAVTRLLKQWFGHEVSKTGPLKFCHFVI